MFCHKCRHFTRTKQIAKKEKGNHYVLQQLIKVLQCVDISADMAYNREMDALKDSKSMPDLLSCTYPLD